MLIWFQDSDQIKFDYNPRQYKLAADWFYFVYQGSSLGNGWGIPWNFSTANQPGIQAVPVYTSFVIKSQMCFLSFVHGNLKTDGHRVSCVSLIAGPQENKVETLNCKIKLKFQKSFFPRWQPNWQLFDWRQIPQLKENRNFVNSKLQWRFFSLNIFWLKLQ